MKQVRVIIVAIILLFSLVTEVKSAMLMEEYLKLKHAKETDIFLIGWLDAITWANVQQNKKTALYCPPDKLPLNVFNLKQIVEEHYEKNESMYKARLGRQGAYFGLIALEALREAFPCK